MYRQIRLIFIFFLISCKGQSVLGSAVDVSSPPMVDAQSVSTTPSPLYEHCARVDEQTIKGLKLPSWGDIQFKFRGTMLVPAQSLPPRPWILGVLADTREGSPAMLSQLDRFKAEFLRSKVMAVVLLGGIAQSYEEIRAVMTRLHGSLPVLALPGDRESRSGFQAAAEVFASSIIDLSRIRAVLAPGVSLLGVPGYHLYHQLSAKEQGCSYDRQDIQALIRLAKSLPAPRWLLSYSPPRGKGVQAVDRAFGGINAGDPLIEQLMKEAQIPFGLFAHLHESAGKATTLDGKPVAEMEWSSSLLLNVGAADVIAHEDLQGHWSQGTAAIVEINQGKARYRMIPGKRVSMSSQMKTPN